MGIKHEDVKASGEKGRASEWNKDHTIDGNVDFRFYAAENMLIHGGVAFPVGPGTGQIFYRTDEQTAYIYNGTDWVNIMGIGFRDIVEGGTLVIATNTANNVTNLIYTIPVGKVGYVVAVCLVWTTTAATVADATLLIKGTEVVRARGSNVADDHGEVPLSFPLPLKLVAGEKLEVMSGGNGITSLGAVELYILDA